MDYAGAVKGKQCNLVCFVEIQSFQILLKQIQGVRVVQSKLMFGSGTPHTKNCSQYSGSTDHTCVIVEPPLQRTA